MLAWNQAEPSRQVTALVKGHRISDDCCERSRGEWSDPRDGEQTSALLFFLNHLRKLPVDFFDLRLQLLPLVSKFDQSLDGATDRRNQPDPGILTGTWYYHCCGPRTSQATDSFHSRRRRQSAFATYASTHGRTSRRVGEAGDADRRNRPGVFSSG